MLSKKSPAAFLLLPILVFIFMFGWIIYFAGQSKSNAKKAPPKDRKHTVNQSATENDLEIGLIAELPQEQAIKE
jgi:hypothetical protein